MVCEAETRFALGRDNGSMNIVVFIVTGHDIILEDFFGLFSPRRKTGRAMIPTDGTTDLTG